MANAGHRQSLLAGGGGEECSGTAEENSFQLTFIEFIQQFPTEGNGTAPTSGAAGVHILGDLIENQGTAIGKFPAQG